MKVGLIGRTHSGRNTLFNAVTGLSESALSQGKPRLGSAKVGDARVDVLSAICNPKKTVHAEVTLALPFVPFGTRLDLTPIRELRDLLAYVHVIGAFGEGEGAAQALEQINELNTEMVLSDMERVEKRHARITKGGGDRPGEKEVLERAATLLESEQPLRLGTWDETEDLILRDLGLMSQRPMITVINVDEGAVSDGIPTNIAEQLEIYACTGLWLCATLEEEIAGLDRDAQLEFLAEYDLKEPIRDRFTQACLALLNLICFFTIGPDEVRAWTIPRETNARRAARAIHSDLEKGFIRAEVINYDDFVEVKSEAKLKAAGRLRVEGREYIVQDGEILTIRFNV